MQQKKNIALLVVCLLVIAGAAAMGFHFKQAAEETWLERQKTLSAENFKIRNLL